MTDWLATRILPTVALGCALMLVALGAQTPSRFTPPRTLAVPERTNANVSLAANGSFVAAAWAASLSSGTTDIYVAVSRDNGSTFDSAVRVNLKADDAHVNGEQPPRLVIRGRGNRPPEVVVVWTSKSSSGGTIVSARSSDGGKTFGATTVIAGADGPGNRGWENIALDRAGNVHVVWLDHRELAQSGSMNHTAEHHMAPADSKQDAVAAAQLSKLYTATLGEAGSSQAVAAGVCYCCKTAIAAGAESDIYLAWRHVYPQNIRDMAFTESHDGGRTFSAPIRVSEDKWQIEGCPEDGPALALDSRRRLHVVWPTLVNDTPNSAPSIGIFYTSSDDARGFEPRQRVPTDGVPHHPQVAIAHDSLYLAWDELKSGARRVVVAHRPLRAGANTTWSREVLSGDAPGAYPTVAASEAGLVVAWTSGAPNSVIRVSTAKF
jgi:hypothetical protein